MVADTPMAPDPGTGPAVRIAWTETATPTEQTMPRTRLKWMPTANGWRWGRYQIECLAPRLWVLTEMGSDLPGALSSTTIITTYPSVRTLTYRAARRASRATLRRPMST